MGKLLSIPNLSDVQVVCHLESLFPSDAPYISNNASGFAEVMESHYHTKLAMLCNLSKAAILFRQLSPERYSSQPISLNLAEHACVPNRERRISLYQLMFPRTKESSILKSNCPILLSPGLPSGEICVLPYTSDCRPIWPTLI